MKPLNPFWNEEDFPKVSDMRRKDSKVNHNRLLIRFLELQSLPVGLPFITRDFRGSIPE